MLREAQAKNLLVGVFPGVGLKRLSCGQVLLQPGHQLGDGLGGLGSMLLAPLAPIESSAQHLMLEALEQSFDLSPPVRRLVADAQRYPLNVSAGPAAPWLWREGGYQARPAALASNVYACPTSGQGALLVRMRWILPGLAGLGGWFNQGPPKRETRSRRPCLSCRLDFEENSVSGVDVPGGDLHR